MDGSAAGSSTKVEPTVSVIVPTKNSERTLKACLVSIRAQSYPQVELIVVDNGSTDATVDIAQELADLADRWGPERTAQRNRGARLASGEYLLFVDSDMVLSPGIISECVQALAAGGPPAAVIPESSVGQGFWAKCRALERACYVGDDLIEAARFFSRRRFEEVGGYDERLIGGDDWDLSQRVAPGARLPRVRSNIVHDEGRIVLRAWLAKKAYYARSFSLYRAKHGSVAFRQANLLFRSAFIRGWRRLAAHPVLALGLVCLKSLELTAALWGVVSSSLQRRSRGSL